MFIHQLKQKIKLDGIEGQIGVEPGGQVSKCLWDPHWGAEPPVKY